MENFVKKLTAIQAELKVPKEHCVKGNSGRVLYEYRNAEDILEKVKPLLKEYGLLLTLKDEICEAGNRIYVKATATITDGEHHTSTTALAREPQNGNMSEPQLTGSCSSYARKYALCGLLLLDDTRDIDEIAPAIAPKAENLQDLKIKLAKELEFLGLEKSQMVKFLQFAYIDTKSIDGIKAFLADENRGNVVTEFLSKGISDDTN